MAGSGHIWLGNYVISGGMAGKHLAVTSVIFHVQLPIDKNKVRNPPTPFSKRVYMPGTGLRLFCCVFSCADCGLLITSEYVWISLSLSPCFRAPSCPEIPEMWQMSWNCPEISNCPEILLIWSECPEIWTLIFKFVASRWHLLRLKCTKFDFGWGSAPDPAEGAYSAPPDAP